MLIFGRIEVDGKVKTFTDAKDIPIVCEVLGAKDFLRETVQKEYQSFIADPYCGTMALMGGSQTFTLKKLPMSLERLERFGQVYCAELDGTYSPETHLKDIDDTYHRMMAAIAFNSFNKDSQAIKNACKVLKIKHTYKAIQAYLAGEN